MRKHHRTIKLPEKMVDAIEQLIEQHPECGYTSIADFVKDSIRHHYCWHLHGIKLEKEPQPP
jgi:Arc/MetJ-type ribon-helix-helix transcriptional regulator